MPQPMPWCFWRAAYADLATQMDPRETWFIQRLSRENLKIYLPSSVHNRLMMVMMMMMMMVMMMMMMIMRMNDDDHKHDFKT